MYLYTIHDRRAHIREMVIQLETPQDGVLSPIIFNEVINRVASVQYLGGVDIVVLKISWCKQNPISQPQRTMATMDSTCKNLGMVINR